MTLFGWLRRFAIALSMLLAACSQLPEVDLATPDSPIRLRIVSWNLAWLADLRADAYWADCAARDGIGESAVPASPPCDVHRRGAIDNAATYEALKLAPQRAALRAAALRGVSIFAFQEVQGAAALRQVLPDGYRIVCTTTRPDALNLAYAVREDIVGNVACSEYLPLSLENDKDVARPLRRGLVLAVNLGAYEFDMLNVHLKAGCALGRMDDPNRAACRLLARQVAPLEAWIGERFRAGRPFMAIGDWNRDLEAKTRTTSTAWVESGDAFGVRGRARTFDLLGEIERGSSVTGGLLLIRVDRNASFGGACHASLDHVVVAPALLRQTVSDTGTGEGGPIRARLVAAPKGASDHCLLEWELTLSQRRPGR